VTLTLTFDLLHPACLDTVGIAEHINPVRLKCVKQFLRYLAIRDFCDLFWPPRVTPSSDIMAPKTDCFMPSSHGRTTCAKLRQNIAFTSLVTKEQMKRWTDGQTNRQLENIMCPASVAWQRHKSRHCFSTCHSVGAVF